NMCLSGRVNVKFSPSMHHTIIDMETIQVNRNNDIVLSKDSNIGHLLDCVRYLFWGQFINLHKMVK
ncbi:MAG: hypothetical protein ACEQSR_16520, partial [Candidatus Methylacidiphilales bacterium]